MNRPCPLGWAALGEKTNGVRRCAEPADGLEESGTGLYVSGLISIRGSRQSQAAGTREAGEDGIRFLLVSGKPLREPVAWYGPIVMNTQEQLQQAYDELREGVFLKAQRQNS
jgi:hypothetical protein